MPYILKEELRNRLNNGERIRLNIDGTIVWAEDKGNGIVSKDLIFASWFKNDKLTSMGIHKDNFSKSYLRNLI